MLHVADPAMPGLVRVVRGSRAPVAPLDQRDRKPSKRRFAGGHDAVDSAADHQNVEPDRGMAREGCALHGVHRNLNWSCRAVTAEVPVAQLEVAGPVVIEIGPDPATEVKCTISVPPASPTPPRQTVTSAPEAGNGSADGCSLSRASIVLARVSPVLRLPCPPAPTNISRWIGQKAVFQRPGRRGHQS